ncbi:hypothetical protein ACB092_07G194100 [Castanea dentata]
MSTLAVTNVYEPLIKTTLKTALLLLIFLL